MKDNTSDDRLLERFPCSSRVTGWIVLVGLAVAGALVLYDGFNLAHAAALAALLLFGLGVWLTMVRPMVVLHRDHVLLRNALTDIAVPWDRVESVEVRQVLVIWTEEGRVTSLVAGRSPRRQLLHRRGGAGPGLAGAGGEAVSAYRSPAFGGKQDVRVDYADAVARRIDDRATTHRQTAGDPSGIHTRWRRVESLAVIGVAVAFGVLLALVIAG